MKRLLLLLSTALLVLSAVDANAQINKKTRQKMEELQQRVDSLQRAYDSLYAEHQQLIEPVSADEEDEVIEASSFEYTVESIDSLLNMYYIQKRMEIDEASFAALDRDSLVSNIPDEVYIERLKRLNSFIPVEFNRYVKNYIILYTNLKSLPNIITLSKYYFPIIEPILDEYNLPNELKCMAIIESAFNPRAVSRAKAKGMWQFMHHTARRYGLEIDSYVDERYDPEASCRAAAQYLKDAYDIFGDWPLAIASYNCGAGNVLKAIRRSGGKTSFWGVYDYLPRETRGYVPAFIGALYAIQYWPDHGITPAPFAMPAHVDTFHVNRNLHFGQISGTTGIPIEMLRDLNPMYLHDIIPGNTHEYIVRIPSNYSDKFIDHEQDMYEYKDSVYFNPVVVKKIESGSIGEGERVVHKVRSGETLGSIARRYRVTVSQIKNWNGLRNNNIRVGQRLTIYGKGSTPKTSASSSKSGSKTVGELTTDAAGGYATYKIRKGDTLYEVARRNGVSLNSLYELNNLNKYSKIYPGMVIRVKKVQ